MKPAYLIVAAALLGVGALLYLALDSGGGRSAARGTGAADESTRTSAESPRERSARIREHGPRPDGTAGVEIIVRPAGIAEVIVTGPRSWRGRTDTAGRAFVGWMPHGRYAVSARREAAAAARTFDVEGDEISVELELADGIAVRGHVFDARGRPIAGATVEAVPESERNGINKAWNVTWLAANSRPPIYASATADENGAYTLMLPAPGRYTLEVRARGFAGTDERPRPYDEPAERIDFHLQAGAEVAGRVLGPDDIPVGGALVGVASNVSGQAINIVATTAADGSFRLDVPLHGWSNLTVHARGYAPRAHGTITPPVEGLIVRIGRGVRARARLVITDTGGQPAVGVGALLSFRGGSRTATSDGAGGVSFDQVSEGGGGIRWRHISFVGGGFVAKFQPLGGKLAEQRHRACAFGHGALKMWNASHHVDAKIQRRRERGARVGVA